MKSIVEEASSIKQAIENGWKRLGEPTIFSVKILEKPELNFLGFSKKPAKIALIVEDTMQGKLNSRETGYQSSKKQPFAGQTETKSREKESSFKKNSLKDDKKNSTQDNFAKQNIPRQNATKENFSDGNAFQEDNSSENASREITSKWSEQRVDIIKDWFTKTLLLMNKGSVKFKVSVEESTLHITLNEPLLSDNKNERFVFASIGHLMMETLRNKSKKILRNMRIIISNS